MIGRCDEGVQSWSSSGKHGLLSSSTGCPYSSPQLTGGQAVVGGGEVEGEKDGGHSAARGPRTGSRWVFWSSRTIRTSGSLPSRILVGYSRLNCARPWRRPFGTTYVCQSLEQCAPSTPWSGWRVHLPCRSHPMSCTVRLMRIPSHRHMAPLPRGRARWTTPISVPCCMVGSPGRCVEYSPAQCWTGKADRNPWHPLRVAAP